MHIIYRKPEDAVPFDLERFYKSLNQYGEVSKQQIMDALGKYSYNPMHVSVLREIGASLIPDEAKARKYYQDCQCEELGFERLRRITGLVK